MRIRLRTLFLALTVLSLLTVLMPFVVAALETASSYRGTCFSIEWGERRCSRAEFAFEAAILCFMFGTLPLGASLLPFWLLAGWQGVVAKARTVSLWGVALLVVAIAGAWGVLYYGHKSFGWLL